MTLDKHNQLMQKFVRGTLREMIDGSKGYGEILSMLEGIMLGIMMVLVKIYKLKPDTSAAMVEFSFQQALVRFTAEMNNDKKD
jgi:hypothetical protein